MTLRKKLIALAVPAVLAAFAIPVAVAHAQASTPARIAVVHAFVPAQALMPTRTAAVHAKSVTSARTAETQVEPVSSETGDPAGTDAAGGHADAGSNVDHQFDGQE